MALQALGWQGVSPPTCAPGAARMAKLTPEQPPGIAEKAVAARRPSGLLPRPQRGRRRSRLHGRGQYYRDQIADAAQIRPQEDMDKTARLIAEEYDTLLAEIQVAVANEPEAKRKNGDAEAEILGDQGQSGGRGYRFTPIFGRVMGVFWEANLANR
jgi:hypothetical protein